MKFIFLLGYLRTSSKYRSPAVIHLRMLHLQLPADYKAKHGLSFLMTKQVKSRCVVCDAEFLFTNTKAGV